MRKLKRLSLARAAMTLLIVMLTTMTTWAENDPIGSIQYNSSISAYEIKSTDNLNDLAVYVNGTGTYSTGATENTRHDCGGKIFKMTANITYPHAANETDDYDENYTPIGRHIAPTNYYFRGEFDGGDHTVSGIRLRKTGKSDADGYQGLFGYIGINANVHHVHLTDARIKGDTQTGGIVGRIDWGTVSNCTITESEITTSVYGGVITGYNYNGTLSNNYYHGCTVTNLKVTDFTSGVGVGNNHGTDITDNDGALPVFTLTLGTGVTAANATVTIRGTNYYKSDATVILNATAQAGYMANYTASKTADGTDITASVVSGSTLTMPAYDVTVAATYIDMFGMDDGADGTAANPYVISNEDGWNFFCDALQDNDTYNRFSGKTVYLGNNIGSAQAPITRIAGSSKHDFCGTFNGQGYTLYVNLTSDNAHDYTAPFSYVANDNDSPATINNLKVAGTVNASKDYASGIVGAFWGTLTIENCTSSVTINTGNKHAAGFIGRAAGNVTMRNCLSSVTINSSTGGDGTHGGLIGVAVSGKTFTIEGCAFTGSLLSTGTGEDATINCGGFVGYNSGTLTFTNSFYAPADPREGEKWVGTSGSATFARGTAPTVCNCYYTQTLGELQGIPAHTIAAGENVTVEHAGTATEYSVSGITAYKASDAHGDNDPFIDGLVYNEVLYAGSGNQVSLTLSNNAPAPEQGYQYGYTASAGTLSGTLLTMPDEDVTVNVALVPIDWATVNAGTSADPYMIYNKDQLLLLAYRVNGTHGETANTYENKYFKLGANITFTYDPNEGNDDYAENYESIGRYNGTNDFYFNGDFDGAGNTVSGIRIRKTGKDTSSAIHGLFGQIDKCANIHHVHLTDARIKGNTCIGGILGYNFGGSVSNCTVTESAITASTDFGTICGYSDAVDLSHNYYRHCTVNGTAVTSGKGCDGADIDTNDGAMPMYVAYIDADGNQQRCIDYTELTSGAAQTLAAGWYVARGTVDITGTLTLGGDVNLILADDAQVNIGTEQEPISSGRCIVGSYNYSLTIYGQTAQSGTLNAYNSSYAVNVKNYTQHGGTITIDSGNMDALYLNGGNLTLTRGSLTANANINGAGIYGNATVSGGILNAINGYYAIEGALTMSGGTVTANATNFGIYGDATVSGGNLTATSNLTAIGDDLALSGTATVKVTGSISDNVTIAAGQVFTDGNGHYYAGTLTAAEKTAINGQKLTRLTALQLADAADNTDAIAKCNGATGLDITLKDRTLWKDGAWNTLCLPFDVTITGSILDGDNVEAMVLRPSDSGLSGTTLNLYFDAAPATIPAGTPFLIKWANTGVNLTNPTFTGVTISSMEAGYVASTDGYLRFQGIYSPTVIYSADHDKLFLGAENKLYWPDTEGYTLGACRAYFLLTDPNAKVREFNLNFGEEETSSVHSSKFIVHSEADAWYTVNGVKLDKEPTKKGMYIHGNRKVVIK